MHTLAVLLCGAALAHRLDATPLDTARLTARLDAAETPREILALVAQRRDAQLTGREVLRAFKALAIFADVPGLNATKIMFHKPFAQQRAFLGTLPSTYIAVTKRRNPSHMHV